MISETLQQYNEMMDLMRKGRTYEALQEQGDEQFELGGELVAWIRDRYKIIDQPVPKELARRMARFSNASRNIATRLRCRACRRCLT